MQSGFSAIDNPIGIADSLLSNLILVQTGLLRFLAHDQLILKPLLPTSKLSFVSPLLVKGSRVGIWLCHTMRHSCRGSTQKCSCYLSSALPSAGESFEYLTERPSINPKHLRPQSFPSIQTLWVWRLIYHKQLMVLLERPNKFLCGAGKFHCGTSRAAFMSKHLQIVRNTCSLTPIE